MRKRAWLTVLLTSVTCCRLPAQEPQADRLPAPETPHTVLQTTVRRVVVDVTVTDAKGNPVPGLARKDFKVTENGEPQAILSFDVNGFSPEMDYIPPSLPKQPANTFINLPATPEKGPLYALLYDLVDMDDPSQMDTPEDHHLQSFARQQMMKFIQSKPEGARFAIYVRSDGLHLLQGFTSDKTKLYAALDPHTPHPHMPRIFLMGANYGRGNRLGALDTLHLIALALDGLPGRKNLIWFSSMFPLSLFPEQSDGPNFQEETKATLDLLAHNQIAIYPVDARGVAIEDSHEQIGTGVHGSNASTSSETTSAGNNAVSASPSSQAGAGPVQGQSALANSFNIMDAVARETGGRAFYGTNDIANELQAATASGGTYYTLTYSPTNRNFDGNLRTIRVELVNKRYDLAYRRSYYGTDLPGAVGAQATTADRSTEAGRQHGQTEPVVDTLSANMEHGAPEAHQLVFIVQARPAGEPANGTPEQMAELATEPAYFKLRRRSKAGQALPPVPLQKDVFVFSIPVRQFQREQSLDLEIAAAAYDADGQLMNAVVRLARKEGVSGGAKGEQPRFYRIEQELMVPVPAVSVRFAVRDVSNDKTGAMEVALPFAPETAIDNPNGAEPH